MNIENERSDTSVVVHPEVKVKAKKVVKAPCMDDLIKQASRDARKSAAVILEVLAGVRLPSDAAAALSTSLARYYQLEIRALRGLVAACEPKPKGRAPSPEKDLANLKRENIKLKRSLERYSALARMNQRAIGIAPAPATTTIKGKRSRRKRTPTTRALKVAEQFQRDDQPAL